MRKMNIILKKQWLLISFIQEFAGNTDQNTVVYHDLNPSMMARYIRFRPATWHSHISLRVELYGCKGNQDYPLKQCRKFFFFFIVCW